MDLDHTTALCDKAIELFLNYREILGYNDVGARDAAVKDIRRGLESHRVVAPALPSLSDPQRRVLDALRSLQEREGYSPTVREIGATAGLRSSSTVHGHLKALTEKGCIAYGGVRKIRILV